MIHTFSFVHSELFLSNAIIAFKLKTVIIHFILYEDRRDDGQTSTTADLLHLATLTLVLYCNVLYEPTHNLAIQSYYI